MARSTGGAGLAPSPSGTRIPKPSGSGGRNPFWSQAQGKPWDPALRPTGGAAVAPPPGGPPRLAPRPGPGPAPPPYTPAHDVTTTVTPPPPDMSGNNWQGFLTPDQLQNLYNAGDAYTAGLAQYGPQGPVVTGAQANYQQAMQQAQYAHDVGHRDAAENLAARGMLQSGIAAGDFADLDRSLTIRQSAAQSNLNTILLGAQNAIDNLNRTWGHAQTVGQGQAVIDAAGMAQYQPYQQTTHVAASGGLTPEQVKYIQAGTHPPGTPPPGHPQPNPATTTHPPASGSNRPHVSDPFAGGNRSKPKGGFQSSTPKRVR